VYLCSGKCLDSLHVDRCTSPMLTRATLRVINPSSPRTSHLTAPLAIDSHLASASARWFKNAAKPFPLTLYLVVELRRASGNIRYPRHPGTSVLIAGQGSGLCQNLRPKELPRTDQRSPFSWHMIRLLWECSLFAPKLAAVFGQAFRSFR
jgi:hypothetical protein